VKFAKFSSTGLSVSRLCLGTGTFGNQADEAMSFEIFDRAADAGVNFIDTADCYPMSGANYSLVGRSEEITGRWLKGKRNRFIVGTKGGVPIGPASWDQGSSKKHLLEAIDASLRRLGTDYVDLYQIHQDDPETPLDESLAALDQIVRSGKARYVGVSNFLAYRLARATGRADALKLTRPVSIQPRYNLLFREIERELLPLAQEERLAVIPFNPLAGGLLSGRYRDRSSPDKGRFSAELGQFGAMYQVRYWHDREFETIGRLQGVAAKHGMTLPTMSVAWMLANPSITSVILGASQSEQLVDTLAAADLTLDPALKGQLDDLTVEYRRGDSVR